MKKTITELEISGRKYAYVVTELGREQRFFVMILKNTGWETFCGANGYGYKTMEAARRAFDNRLFYEEHYRVNDEEPRIYVSRDYLSTLQIFKKFKNKYLRHYR
jgi:hypothetical protein